MKLSKIISLLLVPLLLFTLALPAYADGGTSSRLIIFESFIKSSFQSLF